jgi:nucleoside permease NupC
MQHLQSALGIVALLGFAWPISENRGAFDWKSAGVALLVTLVTAVLLLKVPAVKWAFAGVARAVDAIASATLAGTSFVFGYIGGAPLPFDLKIPGAEFVLAFQVLPIVLVMSVLTTLLFFWRILPPIVRGFSWAFALDERSRLIILYAMCGFANFASLGIMIAGLSAMTPERRTDILSLCGKSIVSDTLTTCLMGAIVGLLN